MAQNIHNRVRFLKWLEENLERLKWEKDSAGDLYTTINDVTIRIINLEYDNYIQAYKGETHSNYSLDGNVHPIVKDICKKVYEVFSNNIVDNYWGEICDILEIPERD